MNKLKKSVLYCLTILLACSFLISPFPNLLKKQTTAVEATENQLIGESVFNYLTLSTAGKVISSDNIKSIDSDNDGKLDTSYIIANGTITITFKPLLFSYYAEYDASNYYAVYSDPIVIKKTNEILGFPSTFTYKGEEYRYSISTTDSLLTITKGTNSSITDSHFVSFSETDEDGDEVTDTRTFVFLESLTLKASAPNTSFKFSATTGKVQTEKLQVLNFERPVLDFKTNDITWFSCYGLDVGNTSFENSKIERELSYENVKLEFTNNNYTEHNPLYFDINHNGFIYTFKLFSKIVETVEGDKELLFVDYYDEQKNENNTSLATKIDSEGNLTSAIFKYIGDTTNFNRFSINFNKTGRYEISVYDSTYLLLKNQAQIIMPDKDDKNEDGTDKEPEIIEPEDNKFNYNFYQTSFYIKTSDSSNSDSAFENAYAIMQSYDDDGNLMDYIVSESTQNTNVQITVKNLSFYFDNDSAIKNFTATETLPELYAIEFIKTTLAGSLNIPVSTYYSVEEIKEHLKTNKDFSINCTEDAFYEIIIYQYDATTYREKASKSYQFTIVKQPKISFTYYNVDENHDRIFGSDGKPLTTIHEADTPYETMPETYKINIDSSMEFSSYFSAVGSGTETSTTLNKTYLNEYTINYAMQQVKIEKISSESDDVEALGLRFFGVGEIKVTISVNSTTTTYIVESGDSLSFEAYGTYSVSIEDSMGTVGTEIFVFSKPVSTSAIILIVLVGVIALAVVLFIISSRGKVKTR